MHRTGSELAAGAMAVPTVRTDFSDTALWQPHLTLDESGQAETEINFPQSLTTWRIRGYLVTSDTRVGDLTHDVVTSKNLLVRLQRPRFLIERDEVVLSANVHNNLKSDKTVTAELLVPAGIFQSTVAGDSRRRRESPVDCNSTGPVGRRPSIRLDAVRRRGRARDGDSPGADG